MIPAVETQVTDDPLAEIVSRHGAERISAREERDRLERLIARHQARIESLPRRNVGTALQEIAELIQTRTGLSTSISGPFGMENEYAMRVSERETVTGAFFKVRPQGDGVDPVLVDLSSDNGQFPPGSVGRMNGAHMDTVPMPSLDELLTMIDEQRAVNRLRRSIA